MINEINREEIIEFELIMTKTSKNELLPKLSEIKCYYDAT